MVSQSRRGITTSHKHTGLLLGNILGSSQSKNSLHIHMRENKRASSSASALLFLQSCFQESSALPAPAIPSSLGHGLAILHLQSAPLLRPQPSTQGSPSVFSYCFFNSCFTWQPNHLPSQFRSKFYQVLCSVLVPKYVLNFLSSMILFKLLSPPGMTLPLLPTTKVQLNPSFKVYLSFYFLLLGVFFNISNQVWTCPPLSFFMCYPLAA